MSFWSGMHPGAAAEAAEQQVEAICMEMTFVFRITHQPTALTPHRPPTSPQAAAQWRHEVHLLCALSRAVSPGLRASAWWWKMCHLTRGPASSQLPLASDKRLGTELSIRTAKQGARGVPPSSFQNHPLECTSATCLVRAAGAVLSSSMTGSSICQPQGRVAAHPSCVHVCSEAEWRLGGE